MCIDASAPLARTYTELTQSGIRKVDKRVVTSYHKSSRRVMVSRQRELWQLVTTTYGKSLHLFHNPRI
ncbi:hypothetical protein HMPREF9134_01732 [Porphyromonas catoniae F0037]|uniref:Uncharacterized protein n=1 Tax=Porphyromonas catoniae F0037 TaxID=1127696 RepID=L1NAK5_9PORP|nr:hypothetical protein HMPREF9134_01732 [Porphyromonas catoniae F0037]